MPNIEIHGKVFADQIKTAQAIEQTMLSIGFEKELVVTYGNTMVQSYYGKDMPYIRICDTNMKRAAKIVSALRKAKLSIDMEVLKLHRFIPSDKVK